MRGRYLWAREVTAELLVASASCSEARARENCGGGGSLAASRGWERGKGWRRAL